MIRRSSHSRAGEGEAPYLGRLVASEVPAFAAACTPHNTSHSLILHGAQEKHHESSEKYWGRATYCLIGHCD